MGVSEEASVVEASVGEGETHQDGLPRLFPSPAAVPLVFLPLQHCLAKWIVLARQVQ